MSVRVVPRVSGLPQPLPAGEQLLWQGKPDWRALALSAFHVRKVAIYLALVMLWRAVDVAAKGGSAADAAVAVLWLMPLAIAALGILLLLAWLASKTAVYTITSRRVVMQVGIVLSISFNIPFTRIKAVQLRANPDGSGDLPLSLADTDQIAYVHLWPHARPWRIARAEPMLRAVADAAQVAQVLSTALSGAEGGAQLEVAQTPKRAARMPSPRSAMAHG
jgi:Bacterial PH domain